MDSQAGSLYGSLTDLLDLKQKHSNALEARFAGDQAVIAARQGQTIMVFTIVTIIFLPMSFIAAFFAINLPEWEGLLTIGYVSKYMFGIGLGISIPMVIMAITFTDISDGLRGFYGSLNRKLRGAETGKSSENPSGDNPPDDEPELKIETISMKGRPSTHYNGPVGDYWHSFGPSGNGRSLYSRDREGDLYGRLSPISARMTEHPKPSIGSGNAISWARPSMERGRRDFRDDLERGRSVGASSRRWA